MTVTQRAEVSWIVCPSAGEKRGKFNGRRYSRAEDLFKIEDLLDVVHLLLPRLSSAGVSVLSSHGAASPAASPADSGYVGGRLLEDGRMRGTGRWRKKGEFKTKRKINASFLEGRETEAGERGRDWVFVCFNLVFGEQRCCAVRCGRTM